MAVYTTEDTDAIDGGIISGTWRADTNTVSIANSQQWVGFEFVTPHTLSAGDGFGNTGNAVISPIGFSAATLAFDTGTSFGSPDVTWTAYVEVVPDASAWTTASSPVDRTVTAISDATFHAAHGDANPETHFLTITSLGLTAINSVIRSSRYRGRLLISLKTVFVQDSDAWQIHMSEGLTAPPPTLTTVEFPDHTGFGDSWRSGIPGRGTHDDRFGFPVHTGEWERDGYTGSLRVLPGDSDPEDPVDEYTPRPSEGVVEDDPA